jgi:metallo-beta-lactamase family protein
MQVTFHGAVREVTGSMHLLERGPDRILMDCGMFQGRRRETEGKNRELPFDPASINTLVLSHAHIDHSGRIPMITRDRFSGRVVCTRVTSDACAYLLRDSAHIQESDADYLNYKTARNFLMDLKARGPRRQTPEDLQEIKRFLRSERHALNTVAIREIMDKHHIEAVTPLYTRNEAEEALSFFEGYPYRHSVMVGQHLSCTFYDAGHILGSAISILRSNGGGRAVTVGYTGDIGRFGKPILKDPTLNFDEADRRLDLLIMESTYGNREHEPVAELKPRLQAVILETHGRGGSLIIPSFAFGRTQELLYVLHELYTEGVVPRLPIYVDSPLASQLTRVFGEHPEVYDRDTHKVFLENGRNPFFFDQVHFVSSVQESMALNREKKPHVVIAASGMCEAGRILHHLRFKVHNADNTILIVGFMAQNTLGRRILDLGSAYQAGGRRGPAPVLRFLNKEYPLKARVVKIDGFSAHADRDELLRFLKTSNLRIKRIAVVHGEEEQSLAFAGSLRLEGFEAFVPKAGETVAVA